MLCVLTSLHLLNGSSTLPLAVCWGLHPSLLQALLAFLNTESERLVGRHTAITSAAAAAVAAAATGHSRGSSASSNAPDSDDGTPRSSSRAQKQPTRPGQSLFKAMQRGILGLGSKLQGLDQQQSSDGGSQQQEGSVANNAQAIQQQWVQLSQLCWCPVLTDAPDAALPWRPSSTSSSGIAGVAGGNKPQRLAAPCAVRPNKDLWLVSAVKAVVDGECQSQVALAGLGW